MTFKNGFIRRILPLFLAVLLLLGGCKAGNTGCIKHRDGNSDGVCDRCYNSVYIYLDLYSVSGLFGTPSEKLTEYLSGAQKSSKDSVVLSAGNMLDGEYAKDTLNWMNDLGFDAMTVGQKEFGSGEKSLKDFSKLLDAEMLAINIFNKKTGKLADFCKPSTIIKEGGLKIGVIGAIGDCYSSIQKENCDEVEFKGGAELTKLITDESNRLRKKGVDFVILLLHDGYSQPTSDGVEAVSGGDISHYYDIALSKGYVDIVFEGRTQKNYRLKDALNVYHLQATASDQGKIAYAELSFNTVEKYATVSSTKIISTFTDVYVDPNPSGEGDENSTDDSSSNSGAQQGEDTTQKPTGDSSGQVGANGQTDGTSGCKKHTDVNGDTICDTCKSSVIVYFDFYGINDLHGKFADTSDNEGVDELTTYLKNARKTNKNAIFLSAGDMWQGSAESNMTKGNIITDWMNELDFAGMAIGNHEYDWGSEYIRNNDKIAEFPFLAINVYDRSTNKLVDYCEASTMVESDGLQIGIIGAVGDCYSSIAVDKSSDVYFKTGAQLTALVKAESERLKKEGADFIVYLIHDGYGSSTGSLTKVSSSQISSYYDTSLSNGYVNLVFEGHTHQGYMLVDEYGVYHLQHRGDNKGGISHAEVAINSVTQSFEVSTPELITISQYKSLSDDPLIDTLLKKYESLISPANRVLGYNKVYRRSDVLRQLIADLYYQLGVKTWEDEYDIALGGGFITVRSPYNLQAGNVTYATIQSIFPFDNDIVLCSIKGRDLKSKFFNTSNSDYFIAYGDYGERIKNNIDQNATYYVVVDTYTAYYAPNRLTVVETYTPGIYARDLLAEYIEGGGLS